MAPPAEAATRDPPPPLLLGVLLAGVSLSFLIKSAGSGKSAATDARAWLRYARAMGRRRLLTRHPLNPRLLAAEMVADMPGS